MTPHHDGENPKNRSPNPQISAERSDSTPAYIGQSWNRSRAAGLTPDHVISELQYVQDLDLQRRLVQCAGPILDRLHNDMNSIPLALALTDERARVILRRDTDRSLANNLDQACFAPGFDYSETRVGTNGVGTAIEARMPVYIHGPQHFNEILQDFTCAGAPVHDPLSGKLEGILDISCMAKDANPMMQQLAIIAARDIEAALASSGSAKQLAVMDAFIGACRRRSQAVYSLSCGIFMSNSSGAPFIDPVDEAFLREEAQGMLTPSGIDQYTLILPSGQWISVRRTLVQDGNEPAGIVLEVDAIKRGKDAKKNRSRAPSLPGAVGGSSQWEVCRAKLSELATAGTNTLLIGERGSGRVTLARGAHLYKNPQARCSVVDCSSPEAYQDVEYAISSNSTSIILRRIDDLSPQDDLRILQILSDDQHVYPARWIAATSRADSRHSSGDPTPPSPLTQLFTETVDVPALRHHAEDIPAIINLHAAQLVPHRDLQITDTAIRSLKKYSWPGNVTELIKSIKYFLQSKPTGEITESNLPAYVHSAAPTRRMTALELTERDAIIEALRKNDGNRVDTAKDLGISRSTLYRRITSYGIHL